MKRLQWVMLGVCAMFLASCGNGKQDGDSQIATVRVDTVCAAEDEGVLQYPGRVVAATEANISFKVAGTLRRVYVSEGDHVSKGQLVAELDDSDYKIQLAATKAEHAQIKADAERVMALYKEGGTTASNYDKARYGLQQIEAKLQNHTNQLAYTKIYAPCDGYVQTKYFDSNETVAAGMPVVSIMGSGALEVEVNLPATSYVHRSDFKSYNCTMDVLPGQSIPLQLISILPQANANQLYTMRLRLQSADKLIAPGMSTWVSIRTDETASLQVVVPSTAIVEEKGKAYLYIYNRSSETVKRVDVEVQKLHTNGTSVVLGNIHQGDLVVSTGAHCIKNGDKVKLLAPISPTNTGGLL